MKSIMFILNKLVRLISVQMMIQSINLIETYAHKASNNLVCEEEENECNNTIKQYKNV